MRALVVDPEILFLDEPFSALDYEMTLFMREQLQRIFVETGTTTVLVSHDLEEAVYLADRILLLSRGPAQIADFVHYDAPRLRTDDTLSDPRITSYNVCYTKLLRVSMNLPTASSRSPIGIRPTPSAR